MNETLFAKVGEFTDKFKRFFVHKKKVKALNSYSEVAEFKKSHKTGLKLIQTFVDEGFLEEADVTYLNHLLDRYNLKFTEWAHATKWRKEQEERIRQERKGMNIKPKYRDYTIFDLLEEKRRATSVEVPVEILANVHHEQRVRA